MEISWKRFTPLVVEPGSTPSAVLEVKVDGSPTEVRLELASTGVEVALRDDGVAPDAIGGDAVFTIELSIADLTYDFDISDVNRNFVGFLRLYDGSSVEQQNNVFIDVLTSGIASVDLEVVAADVQLTDHLVNIFDPALLDAPPSAATTRFYDHFGDDYDFINVVYTTSRTMNRHHIPVKNEVTGIGMGPLDNAAAYGSAGRLMGATVFPISTMFDAAARTHSHELGHQWVNFLPVAPLNLATPHWPLSDLAAGVMGYNTAANPQGLRFPFHLKPEGSDYRLLPREEPDEFSDLTLYLMGLLPDSEVSNHFVFDNQSQTPTSGGTLLGPVTPVTMADILAALGARSPSHSESKRRFRVGTVIVSDVGLLPERAMRLYDHFAARGSATEIVSFSDGFAQGEAKPFYVATKGRGCLNMAIKRRILVDASRDGGVWWYPQIGPFDSSQPHQGFALAEHLRSLGHLVTELGRTPGPDPITDELLARYDMIVRAGGLGDYDDSEIEAYQGFVKRGGGLLLLADHGPADHLTLSFGLQMEGVNRCGRQLTRFVDHTVTEGVAPLHYQAGAGVTAHPAEATIVGRLSRWAYLDVNENRRPDRGEPWGPAVLGVMPYGCGRIVFCGDANLWQSVPQPLVRNTLEWLDAG
jgi:hypothetical protein